MLVALVIVLWALSGGEEVDRARELDLFKWWLEVNVGPFACDEGPAAFVNETVSAAYDDDSRFYYVLTYPRGIAPPFERALSLVARIDDKRRVQPLRLDSVETFREGLVPVTSTTGARRAAAAVLILAYGDPGQRRWRFDEAAFEVKRGHKGWTCTYHHDNVHASRVRFDWRGDLVQIECGAPPVP
jgi:hypothetical protein